ncbi:hypothetical protein FFK22_032755 [Mycobacterium sp. KBS0706]|uniref:hypothetical protein n=1 Tax=Mycobacterium sp. KBS0706 TaxID=2578109 RepID=UPI00110F7A25|nr:hypothetical protein [Mycobacterium sp. KBS0706]TSD84384.1 hypothetical protein FFK22_032755 [Mycobacterium sp. KBS0706]
MATDADLREKLRKIEALHAGAGTEGERLAAAAALERIRARLRQQQQQQQQQHQHQQQQQRQQSRAPAEETKVSLPDQWSRHLFVALCRRYGLRPFRYKRQRRTTVMVRAPRGFVDRILWPEFQELNIELRRYLHAVTLRLIRDEIHADTTEAPEVAEPAA